MGDTDSRLGARRVSATWPGDVGGGPGAANVLFSCGRWKLAEDEKSGSAPFKRDLHSVSRERAGIRNDSTERRRGDPERGLALQFNRFRNSYVTDWA